MSVYIHGMEMPKSCLVCSCTDTEYGECVLDPEKRCPEDYGKRADWCPLVPVPNHGRLIDADALAERFWDGQCYFTDAIKSKLQSAPTIIPADKEEEG